MVTVRELGEADLDASWQLGRLTFGWNTGTRTPPAHDLRPDEPFTRWGAFDDRGRLVGKAIDLHHEQWWGGRLLPASGVAGVAVEPEQRGRGAGRDVMIRLLHEARERGAVVAALFCTSTAVYRSLGFEATGVLRDVDVPTAHLPRRVDGAVQVRAATGRDWPAIRAVYDEVARSGQGLLSRTGRLFGSPTGDELPDGLDGVTLAEDADATVVGYASWQRGTGYDNSAVITVPDCLALTADAAAALLATLGGWVTVAPTVRLRPLPWFDAVSARLPWERAVEHRAEVWMHRPLDVAGAVAARGWPATLGGSVSFGLVDPLLSGNDGHWRLTVADGDARLEPEPGDPSATLTVRGWSLLWCGVARCAQLRQTGMLTGDTAVDGWLDQLLAGGGPAAMLDYF